MNALVSSVAVLAVSLATTHAATITVGNVQSWALGGGTTFASGDYTTTGASILLLGVGVDASPRSLTDVTFNGVAPSGIIEAGRANLLYWVNPTAATGTFAGSITGGNNFGGYGLVALELSNVDTTVSPISGSSLDPATSTITTTAPNTFIASYIYSNNGGTITGLAPGSVLTLDAGSPFNTGSQTNAIAYGTVSAPGTNNIGIITTNAEDGQATFAFVPVPEPGTVGLLFGSIGFVVLRRRRAR